MAEQKGAWRTVRGRRIFIAEGEDLATAMKKSGKFDDMKEEGKKGTFIAENGHEIKVVGLKPYKTEYTDWSKYGEYVGGEYKDGLEIGGSFGLRMIGTMNMHNVNVYGTIKKINKDNIEVAHPRGTIYKVPTNNVCTTMDGKELRFKHNDGSDTGWFGFIDIEKGREEIE